ncbi:hypothetical protein [Geotalea toluenoxydans]|uniref:hypothetical protein n=1 Tax=Geotalea toluenoxydans TaxID=421624 RepID=UPI000A611C9A|nr:hypothetical protein [Geotalea toluenoxydans]
MAVHLNNSESGTRENRLGSITAYHGTLRDLNTKSGCGSLGDKGRCYSQASLCNAACALSQLSFITDAAVVHHAPAGCAVTAMQVSNAKDQLAESLGLDNSRSGYVCTDMNDSDVIFGATELEGRGAGDLEPLQTISHLHRRLLRQRHHRRRS